MKLHYTKILLFYVPLITLVTSSSNEHNKKKPYITRYTTNTTSRVLSECDKRTSIYDNEDMKSVKENFDRQTSQRFEEFEERMSEKRQKCKEQCDKDIQKIILKDKAQKSLAEKVEKGCLMCACGLGGGVAPVWGLVSGLWYATWSQYVSTTIFKMSTDAGIQKGLEVGLVKVTQIVTQLSRGTEVVIPAIDVLAKMTAGISAEDVTLSGIFKTIHINGCGSFESGTYALFSTWVQNMTNPIRLRSFSAEAAEVTKAFAEAKTGILTKASNATSSLTTAITVSIIAIVVIVLVMLIIYLILRYRRKKKMKKKLQYTKLLKE
ncbi:PIR protein, putative [Plasmodium sp. gorilla clade G1]|nr:PIR protein, putative [Plasmodium sp. gorilla clade G1]